MATDHHPLFFVAAFSELIPSSVEITVGLEIGDSRDLLQHVQRTMANCEVLAAVNLTDIPPVGCEIQPHAIPVDIVHARDQSPDVRGKRRSILWFVDIYFFFIKFPRIPFLRLLHCDELLVENINIGLCTDKEWFIDLVKHEHIASPAV